MTEDQERFERGLREADFEVLQMIVSAALNLENALYEQESHQPHLFQLRKSLEGIWGCDLPEVKWGYWLNLDKKEAAADAKGSEGESPPGK